MHYPEDYEGCEQLGVKASQRLTLHGMTGKGEFHYPSTLGLSHVSQ